MDSEDRQEEAIELLQQLGLQEYGAKCFVGLTRTASATAKELDEITDVPRTRVYEATRVLEVKGLVEIQHSSPQEFRAVPLEEAIGTLEDHSNPGSTGFGKGPIVVTRRLVETGLLPIADPCSD